MLRPTTDHVVIKRDEAPTMSGRLHLPANAQEQMTIGDVVAVGPDVQDIDVGNRVLHEKFAGSVVEHGGKAYLICEMAAILAIVED